MKKRIIICAFAALILVTAVLASIGALATYKQEAESGVDIMVGMGAAMVIALGIFAIICELDIFVTVYYFLTAKKTAIKSMLTVGSSVCLALVFFTESIAAALYVSEESNVFVVLLLAHLLLRWSFFLTLVGAPEKEGE